MIINNWVAYNGSAAVAETRTGRFVAASDVGDVLISDDPYTFLKYGYFKNPDTMPDDVKNRIKNRLSDIEEEDCVHVG